MLSFGWTLVDHYMMLVANRLYYNHKEVRYCCLEKEANHTYKHVASILESNLHVGGILSLMTKVMVARALYYIDPRTSLEVRV